MEEGSHRAIHYLPKLDATTVTADALTIVRLGDLPRAKPAQRQAVAQLYDQAVGLQALVWDSADLDCVPAHTLQAFDNNGGSTLLGFVRTNEQGKCCEEGRIIRAVTVLYHHPAQELRTRYMYSQALGVDPAIRQHLPGIGFAIKKRQREICLEQEIDEVRWTVDPLKSRNANLNIRKLGAVISTFKENVYVSQNHELGAPRFVVAWHLNSRRVRQLVRYSEERNVDSHAMELPQIIETEPTQGVRMPTKWDRQLRDKCLAIEIPGDYDVFQALPDNEQQVWRRASREVFPAYFRRGYVIRGFNRCDNRCFYVLESGIFPREL